VAERKEPDQDNNNKIDYRKLSEIRVQEVENPFVAGNISGIFVSKIGDVAYTVPEENRFISRLGMKRYELVNHLGNVQAVISDRALPVRNGNNVSHYQADLLSATDYYPFGMAMAGRSLNTDDYRYGFNGKEFDQDWDGGGATYDYGARIYDPRVARWASVDPLASKYPAFSPMSYCINSPLIVKDETGEDVIILLAPYKVKGLGHAAVLIGNEKTGWYLYSKNGTDEGKGIKGRPRNDDKGVPVGKLQDFVNSKKREEGGYYYAYHLTSSAEIDQKMKDGALKNLSKDYHLLKCSCIDLVTDVVEAGGFKGANENIEVPNNRYKEIKRLNKGGKEYIFAKFKDEEGFRIQEIKKFEPKSENSNQNDKSSNTENSGKEQTNPIQKKDE